MERERCSGYFVGATRNIVDKILPEKLFAISRRYDNYPFGLGFRLPLLNFCRYKLSCVFKLFCSVYLSSSSSSSFFHYNVFLQIEFFLIDP